jgi:hypothetical protein
MKSKQTAVEWLFSELWEHPKDKFNWYAIRKIATQMEEKQILDFTRKAVRKILDEDRQNPFNLEEYYQETYGSTRES